MSRRVTGWVVVPVAVLAAVLGAAMGVLALVLHRDAVWVLDLMLPWGLAAATLVSVLPSLGLTLAGAGPWAVGAYGAGWCLVVMGLLGGRREGDYLVAADLRGWGFLVVASLAVVVVTMRGVVGPARARRPGAGEPDDLLRRRT